MSSLTTGLTDLPAELIQIILELSVDPDYLAQEKDPKRCLSVLLAPIHTSSRLRAVALSCQPIWRIIAASIPPVISHKTFSHIIELCSLNSQNTLNQINFPLGQDPKTNEEIDWLCDWQDIERSAKSILGSTSSLQAIRFPSPPRWQYQCRCADCREIVKSRQEAEKAGRSPAKIDAAALTILAKVAKQSKKLTSIELFLEHFQFLHMMIMHEPSVTGPGKTSCPLTCVIFADEDTKDDSSGCFVEFCSGIRNLCLVATPEVSRSARNPLSNVLRYAPQHSRCFELHMGINNLGFSGPLGHPSLVSLRIDTLDDFSAAGNSWECPALLYLDVPAVLLSSIAAPQVQMAGLTLARGEDASIVIDSLKRWDVLDHLVLYVAKELAERDEAVEEILLGLLPSSKTAIACPSLQHLAITIRPPAWHGGPFTSDFVNRPNDFWWDELFKKDFEDRLDPTLNVELGSALLKVQRKRRKLAESKEDAVSVSSTPVGDPPLCEALHTIVTVGCQILDKDWERLSQNSNCYREV